MMRLTYSGRSFDDLEGILNFIARDKPVAAIAFTEKLIGTCELIAQNPEIGTRQENLAASLRLFSYRGYGIYYRHLDNKIRIEIRIERFLHHSLDVGQQSFE